MNPRALRAAEYCCCCCNRSCVALMHVVGCDQPRFHVPRPVLDIGLTNAATLETRVIRGGEVKNVECATWFNSGPRLRWRGDHWIRPAQREELEAVYRKKIQRDALVDPEGTGEWPRNSLELSDEQLGQIYSVEGKAREKGGKFTDALYKALVMEHRTAEGPVREIKFIPVETLRDFDTSGSV